MDPKTCDLPNRRVWLRVADPEWDDPLDARWAGRTGGRWNPPASYPTLYLNADLETARLQVIRLLEGTPAEIDDLADDAYDLVAATLPRDQKGAVALNAKELEGLGLTDRYPSNDKGNRVPHRVCQPIGAEVQRRGLRGVLVRSAVRSDGRGTELAWFPATIRSAAHPVWDEPLPVGDWRDAERWEDVGLDPQVDLR